MTLRDFRLIAEWISKNYSSPDKIVEVGIGEMNQTIVELLKKFPDSELIATDTHEVSVPEGIKFVRDDITDPDLSIYRGSDLIYSLRAPPELCPHLKSVAEKVESGLLVKSISSEESPSWGSPVNFSGVVFYVLEP